TRLLFVNFGSREAAYCLPVMAKAREAGISCELYPDTAKMKRQMQYANAKRIPYVAIAGETEMQAHSLTLKDMQTGEQRLLSPEQLIDALL
ncbi:MAG: histidine--tRNA ligase, partial [Prevotellaceae bacterium]|nr:histidine--tRNA ligase [Prevotellaceae bacterium]